MVDRRDTRVSRAASGMTKSAGLAALLVATVLAGGGCSLLPFGGRPTTPRHALRPEIHEVSPNPQPDCIAHDDTADADAIAAEQELSDAKPRPALQEVDGQPVAAAAANAPLSLDAPPCAACGCKAATATAGSVDAAESAAAGWRSLPAPAGPAGFVAAEAGEDELQRLMDGNKRFVECEPENTYQWPQRPAAAAAANASRRPPAAVIVACSDWEVIPEAAFDARPGELFVVRVAGNVADDAVIHSVRYAVERYGVPLIVVLGHESCGAVGAGLSLDVDAAEGRPAALILRAGGAADPEPADSERDSAPDAADPAVHANIDQAVERLRASDGMLSSRIAAGRLRVVGAYYDQTNGQITLQPDATPSQPASEYVGVPRD